jgi:glycosyltransferase involved in cell wall biosynthesis
MPIDVDRRDADTTVVFLLYNAAATVRDLVQALLAQREPRDAARPPWLHAVFVDDCSRDRTLDVLASALREAGSPPQWTVLANETNLGLAGAMNRALARVETPFALTCHCDCLFGGPYYVHQIRELLRAHPEAAVITGRPAVMPDRVLPLVEKLNIVANLVDVVPDPSAQSDVVPIGFAEGKCDGLRMAAIREVGYYDVWLRTSGEDQLMAAKLREHGHELLQAPAQRYFLLVSDEQNTVRKLIRHQRLLARTQLFVVLRRGFVPLARVSRNRGHNIKARGALRALQVLAVPLYIGALAGWLAGLLWWVALAPVAVVVLGKGALLWRHIRFVRPRPLELAAICATQPFFDLSYTGGIVQGLMAALTNRGRRPVA